ncbi:MAG TPA: alpha/beta fold hydrolase [Candidatus Acidoferrales bacterium]|nr:alpha/beta fold hydrolase [Candidatus Acidoferrales bacterium]
MLESATDGSAAPIAAPESDTTARLTHIWQEMLGIESIGSDQNYFDLGGDSILAVQLFIRIEQEFNVKLPLAALFDAPTIRELAEFLERETSATGWSPLVAIQPDGSRPPLFCIHGADGNVLIYRNLSRHLGSDQPFYGLQCRGLDGSCPPLTRIEDMAALYIKEIRREQPHGPYFLGGYCMGGTIALEVAQQLQADGERIALLALFDTTDWSKIPAPSFWGKSYRAAERLVFHAANFFRLDSKGKAQFFSEKVRAFRNRIPVWRGILLARFDQRSRASISESRISGRIWRANDLACVNYVPKPYTGALADFRPMKQYRMSDQPNAKWDRLAQGGHEVVVLPVYPAGMLLNPFVEHLALALKKSIDAAIRSCQVS